MRTVRVWWLFGILALVGAFGSAGRAQEPQQRDEDERLAIARTAMEAQMRLGELYREQGDTAKAEAAFKEALAIYERALAGKAPAAAPKSDVPFVSGGPPPSARGNAPAENEKAVQAGLAWLARHQDLDDDGKWDSDDFAKHDPQDDRCAGKGGALHDVGVTGLALLAFLGAGYTDRGSAQENPYAANVRGGLRYLLQWQDTEGCIGSRASMHFMYGHAIATLALCEAYATTRNPRYREPAQNAVDFILRARNPYLAWRYEPRGGENDTSVTGWCVMALASARDAGLETDPGAFQGALAWIDKMTDAQFGQVGYNFPGGGSARPEGKVDRFPPEKSQAMTASGILTRMLGGQDPRKAEAIVKGANLCAELPPAWNPEDGSIDMYYWYFGTLAMFKVGGTHWSRWNAALLKAAGMGQHPAGAGARTGSWEPAGVWGEEGGRVYSTAIMTLCLEVAYRYDKAFGAR